ncbi:MAG: phage portal protein [Frankia sp.]|nr:phage portal protein [Frankia sp.]
MTVFRRMVNRLASPENPRYPLTAPELVAWLGQASETDSGITVSPERSVQVTAVYRAVSLIAGAAAGLPLKVFRSDRSEVRVPLLERPHPDLTDFELWEYVYVSLLLWGNAYLEKRRDGLGRVVELWPINPATVTVRRGPITSENPSGKEFIVGGKTLTPYDILHIPGLSYDGLVGLSPIQVARQALGLSIAAESLGARLFASGSLLSGVLQTDQKLPEEAARRIKVAWQQKVSGLQRAHEIVVLDAGLKFQPISIPPEDAQFLETRKFQVQEIARLFGVPPHLLMDLDGSTSWGTGIEQQTIGFVIYTLRPWLTRVERRVTVSDLIPQRAYAEYVVEGLLRGDTQQRYQAYATARQWGWMTINEIRVRENLEPVEGGDQLISPLNMAPIGGTDDGDAEPTPADA